MNKKRVLSSLLAGLIVVSVFAGCKKQSESQPVSTKATVSESQKVEDITPSFTESVTEKKELNKDTVGWLQVPYTTISDVVVQSKQDNQYYLRLNFDLEYEFSGVYYADYRNDFGDGTRSALPVNTVIYGHALTDDAESPNYDKKFAPLHEFRDIEFASENPYLFFSTDKEDFVYEIFAVFEANSDNPANPYNKGDAAKGDFNKMVREEIIPRSLYDYGIEITDDDKFLTLSTCIYILEDGTPTYYPDTYFRYAIMARLVEKDSPLVEKIDLTVNEDRVIDPHGQMRDSA